MTTTTTEQPKRGRGRPKGSPNKPKNIPTRDQQAAAARRARRAAEATAAAAETAAPVELSEVLTAPVAISPETAPVEAVAAIAGDHAAPVASEATAPTVNASPRPRKPNACPRCGQDFRWSDEWTRWRCGGCEPPRFGAVVRVAVGADCPPQHRPGPTAADVMNEYIRRRYAATHRWG